MKAVVLFTVFGLMQSLLFTSCLPDHCRDTVCHNGGVCVDGHCSCLNGYEGLSCSEIWNTRFLGAWNGTDKIKGNNSDTGLQYSLQVISNGMPGQFLLMGLHGGMDSVLCSRKSFSEFAIAEKQVDSGIVLVSGSGRIDSVTATITADYTVRFEIPAQTEDSIVTYTAAWTK